MIYINLFYLTQIYSSLYFRISRLGFSWWTWNEARLVIETVEKAKVQGEVNEIINVAM